MALGHKTTVWQMTTVRDIGVKNDQNPNALFIAQFIFFLGCEPFVILFILFVYFFCLFAYLGVLVSVNKGIKAQKNKQTRKKYTKKKKETKGLQPKKRNIHKNIITHIIFFYHKINLPSH